MSRKVPMLCFTFLCLLSGVWTNGTVSLWNVAGYCNERKENSGDYSLPVHVAGKFTWSSSMRKPGSTLPTHINRKNPRFWQTTLITTKAPLRDGNTFSEQQQWGAGSSLQSVLWEWNQGWQGGREESCFSFLPPPDGMHRMVHPWQNPTRIQGSRKPRQCNQHGQPPWTPDTAGKKKNVSGNIAGIIFVTK